MKETKEFKNFKQHLIDEISKHLPTESIRVTVIEMVDTHGPQSGLGLGSEFQDSGVDIIVDKDGIVEFKEYNWLEDGGLEDEDDEEDDDDDSSDSEYTKKLTE